MFIEGIHACRLRLKSQLDLLLSHICVGEILIFIFWGPMSLHHVPFAAGYQSVLTQTVGPAAMDVEAYCSIKDQLEGRCSPALTSKPGIWSLFDVLDCLSLDSWVHQLNDFCSTEKTAEILGCDTNLRGLWSGDCGGSQCL